MAARRRSNGPDDPALIGTLPDCEDREATALALQRATQRSVGAVMLAVILLAGGCSGSDSDTAELERRIADLEEALVEATSTTSPSTTTVPTSTTTPATTFTTSASLPLLLYPGGIGEWRFGASPDEVRLGLVSLLGNPTGEGESRGCCDETSPPSMLFAIWDGLLIYFGTGQDERWPRGFVGYSYQEGAPFAATTPEGIRPGDSLADLTVAHSDGELRIDEPCLGSVFVAPWNEWQGDYYVFFLASDLDRVQSIDAGFQGWC